MHKALVSLALLFALSSAASAQVIYEPVQYQYRARAADGHELTFYYGGNNPRVFDYADRLACLGQGRTGVREGQYGVGYLHHGLIGSPPYRVFSDCAPYVNAAVYGFSPADARNEAYARVPRYFTKAQLLASAAPAAEPQYFEKATPDGIPANGSRVLIAPAQGWPAPHAAAGIEVRPYRAAPGTRPSTAPAAQPAAEPRPLLIIPKRLLEQPKPADQSVVAAQ